MGVVREITAFETSDGKVFPLGKRLEAEAHQAVLDFDDWYYNNNKERRRLFGGQSTVDAEDVRDWLENNAEYLAEYLAAYLRSVS